jgi:alpha-N-acetylglucosamine transferase
MPSIETNGSREEVVLPRAAWATLVTGEKYLPGVAVFAESLLRGSSNHNGSLYPLITMVTSDVKEEAIQALRSLGCLIRPVKRLHPGHSKGDKNMAFAHFGDVWTKLRCFEMIEYDRIIMVDSDMLVLKNMDELFDGNLQDDHIMATFACTCNPSKNPNYPAEW